MKSSFRNEGCLHIFVICWTNFLGLLMVGCPVINKIAAGNNIYNMGYLYEDQHQQFWDDIQLQFLANVDESRFHSNRFHVIQATFAGRNNLSYIIHLTKSEGLYNQNSLVLDSDELHGMDCLYTGTVTEVFPSHQTDSQSESGIVSFSSCHYENGFEGLMLLPDETYYIKPSSKIRNNRVIKRSAPNTYTKPTIPHKALKVDSKTNPVSNGSIIDVILKPSPEDFLEAQLTHPNGNNQESLVDEIPERTSAQPDIDNDVNNSIDETPTLSENEDGGGDVDRSVPKPKIKVLANQSRRKPKARRRPTKKPGTGRNAQASTSSSSTGKVVEIAVFTDEKLHKIWKGRYPKDTTTKMNQYVLAVINNMNALYNQPSMTESISFRLVHLEIATTKPKILKEYSGHASKYLKSFCSYAAEKNQRGSLWDHALMLTGWDINEGGNNSTAGIAWFSTMCINSLSCSLIEGSTFASTFITSHEIGHSLGMDHDGTGPNKNCDANSYLMSPTTGGGKTDWSKCSMKNMKDFLSKGYMGNPSPKCITKKGSNSGSAIHFGSTKLPGQQFDANEQCSVECKGCTPYLTNSAPYNDMCHLLFCQQKTSAYYSLIRSTHPALEGTSCGRGKMCRVGKCQ